MRNLIEIDKTQEKILRLLPITREELVQRLQIPRTRIFQELSQLGDWEFTNYSGKVQKGIGIITKEYQVKKRQGRRKVIFKKKQEESR